MVEDFKCIFDHFRSVNFKIFSNHCEDIECIFSHFRSVNCKIEGPASMDNPRKCMDFDPGNCEDFLE